jgi:hypothetical protein
MTGSTFVTDAELDVWINEGAQKLYELLLKAYDEDYWETSSTISVVAGTSEYSLPSTFFKLLGFDMDMNGQTISLKPYTRAERNAFKNRLPIFANVPRYKLTGAAKVRFLPVPVVAATVTCWYLPILPVTGSVGVLTNATDTIDFLDGWERYIPCYAAIQMLNKEESDSRPLQQQLQIMEQELKEIALERDVGSPHSAVDNDLLDLDPRWGWMP